MSNLYTVGNLIRISVDPANPFKIVGGVITDPTTVTVKYRNPLGAIVSKVFGIDVEVKKQAVGIYYIDVTIDKSGDWYYRWEGTGACQATMEGEFYVEQSRF